MVQRLIGYATCFDLYSYTPVKKKSHFNQYTRFCLESQYRATGNQTSEYCHPSGWAGGRHLALALSRPYFFSDHFQTWPRHLASYNLGRAWLWRFSLIRYAHNKQFNEPDYFCIPLFIFQAEAIKFNSNVGLGMQFNKPALQLIKYMYYSDPITHLQIFFWALFYHNFSDFYLASFMSFLHTWAFFDSRPMGIFAISKCSSFN